MRPVLPFNPQWMELRDGPNMAAPYATETGPLTTAVEQMSEKRRALVEMVAWGGMTPTEAGRKLGVSKQYAHKLWHDVRAELAELHLSERMGSV